MPVVDFREVFDSFRRILIVDDETNVRLILRMTLETEGYEIFESTSGAHALQTLAKHSFALAILDLWMPGMDGLALLARMREDGILVKALELNANSAAGFNLAGVLSELLKDYEKAKMCYDFAIKLDKNYEPAKQNMRRLLDVETFGSCSAPIDLGCD
jgi:CheY-like chemotaxis protein